MNDFYDLSARLSSALGRLHRTPVVLCIGSDRVTGDCIGPIVGHLLSLRRLDCTVVGTLDSPVTALNLADAAADIRLHYAGHKVIAVDSCVGLCGEPGAIRIRRGSLTPGLACGKNLPRVGDVSITATVAVGSSDSLYSVRLGFVYRLAERIACAIEKALVSGGQAEGAQAFFHATL